MKNHLCVVSFHLRVVSSRRIRQFVRGRGHHGRTRESEYEVRVKDDWVVGIRNVVAREFSSVVRRVPCGLMVGQKVAGSLLGWRVRLCMRTVVIADGVMLDTLGGP